VTLREERKFRASVVPQFDTEWCLAPGNGGHHDNSDTRHITAQGRYREGSVGVHSNKDENLSPELEQLGLSSSPEYAILIVIGDDEMLFRGFPL
jgi:hypothetical protein